jgi:hypothetical protein
MGSRRFGESSLDENLSILDPPQLGIPDGDNTQLFEAVPLMPR